jgi:hypothetical protein
MLALGVWPLGTLIWSHRAVPGRRRLGEGGRLLARRAAGIAHRGQRHHRRRSGWDGPAPGDTYGQAQAALARALAAVAALGGRSEDIVRTRLYLAPDADWRAAARAPAELLGEVAPANTTLHVGRLIGEGHLVEVEVEAEVAAESPPG